MEKRKNKDETVEKTVNVPETEKKESKEKEEKILCKDCKYLDTTTIRDFARHGIRQGLIERRGKCTCEKVKARGHLVRIDMPKKCAGFKGGKFEIPQKKKAEKKTVKKIVENNEEKTAPNEYHGPELTNVEKKDLNNNTKKTSKKNIATKQVTKVDERKIKSVTVNGHGQAKTFEKKKGKMVLVKA